MCWFFKRKKKVKEEERQAMKRDNANIPATPKTVGSEKIFEPVVEKAYEKDTAPKVEPKKEQVKTEDLKKEVTPKKPEATKSDTVKKAENAEVSKPKAPVKKYSGKYEVYPEAGSYKFRLKASNGEILAVSFRYTTEKGALSGIDTFKKNVETGVFEVYTDKNNFSQFNLYTPNKGRIVIVGEFYNSEKLAESAVESVKNFYKTNKIEVIEKISEEDIREELVVFENVELSTTGKYEIYQEDGSYFVRLRANNSQVLFVSTKYSSKASAKSGLETIKKAIDEKRFTVGRDKQKRYQFNLYSSTNQLILSGETYPQKSSCLSAITSVRKFAPKAKIVEL